MKYSVVNENYETTSSAQPDYITKLACSIALQVQKVSKCHTYRERQFVCAASPNFSLLLLEIGPEDP